MNANSLVISVDQNFDRRNICILEDANLTLHNITCNTAGKLLYDNVPLATETQLATKQDTLTGVSQSNLGSATQTTQFNGHGLILNAHNVGNSQCNLYFQYGTPSPHMIWANVNSFAMYAPNASTQIGFYTSAGWALYANANSNDATCPGTFTAADITVDHMEINGNDGLMNPTYGYRQLFFKDQHGSGSGANDGWWFGVQNGVFGGSDGDFYFEVVRGGVSTVPAWIQDGTGHTQMNFTGQHRCSFSDYTNDKVGLIVKSTGVYYNLDKSVSPTINDSLPEVELCNTTNCKAVFGVISDSEDDGDRLFKSGNFVSAFKKEDGINRVFINSVGEGGIWVCNLNGNLENGDYITTSTLPGYGQKQNGSILHNYTVAKITQDIDFNNPQSWVETRIDAKWPKAICAFVGCSYHCG